MPPVIDTNVVLRHLLADHPDQSQRATAFMALLDSGERQVVLPGPVLFEIVFMLERREERSRASVRDSMEEILDLRGVVASDKRLLLESLDLHAERNVSLVDAYAAVTARKDIGQVISFDRDFDRIPGITRIEP